MRLTEKDIAYKVSGAYIEQIPDIVEGHKFIGSAITKLGQLEDIEEELGVDLITLFKALKNGIYVSNDEGKIFHQNAILHYDEDFFGKKSYQLYATDGFNYYFKDYGKTWALTKEELL